MSIGFVCFMIAVSAGSFVGAAEYNVHPEGNDGASGSPGAPFATIEKGVEAASPGDVILLRGGTWNLVSTLVISKSGEEGAPLSLSAYEDEKPLLNFAVMEEAPSNRGIVLDGDWWHVKGVVIEEAGDNGMLLSGSHNTLEDCVFRKNRDSGLQLSRYRTDADDISRWPSHNLVLNCEAYDNCDSDHEDADGFAPKLTCGAGNVFRGCVSHHNIDDGWDMYAKSETGPIGAVLLENCIAHNNGTLTDGATSGNGDKNGFKLGSSGILVDHIVRRCIAFGNGKHGFTDNGNISSIEFTNNTSYNNAGYNFHTRDNASHVFTNNISFDGGHTDRIVGNASAPNALTEEDLEWRFTATADDFQTLTPGPHSDPTANGFLQLVPECPFIDAGIDAEGIRFTGEAPDLGALEFNMAETGAAKRTPAATAFSSNFRVGIKISDGRIQYVQPSDTDPGTAALFDGMGRLLGLVLE